MSWLIKKQNIIESIKEILKKHAEINIKAFEMGMKLNKI